MALQHSSPLFPLALLAGLLCGGCERESNPDSTTENAQTRQPDRSPVVRNGDAYSSDRNAWRERLRGSAGQAGMDDVGLRYHEVLTAASPAEHERLRALGFPSVDELQRLSALSAVELQARIDAGDKGALWYLTDQVAAGVRALQVARSKGVLPAGISEMDVGSASLDAMGLARQTLRGVESPFGAYVYGQAMGATSYPPNNEAIAASYLVAAERGDWRAEALYQDYVADHPGLRTDMVDSHRRIMETLMRTR